MRICYIWTSYNIRNWEGSFISPSKLKNREYINTWIILCIIINYSTACRRRTSSCLYLSLCEIICSIQTQWVYHNCQILGRYILVLDLDVNISSTWRNLTINYCWIGRPTLFVRDWTTWEIINGEDEWRSSSCKNNITVLWYYSRRFYLKLNFLTL